MPESSASNEPSWFKEDCNATIAASVNIKFAPAELISACLALGTLLEATAHMLVGLCTALAIGTCVALSVNVPAEASEIWFQPPDSVTQRVDDYQDLFVDRLEWAVAVTHVATFSVPINYLLRAPRADVEQFKAFMQDSGLKLNVVVLALPVDKHRCGDKIEGMVWPGEVKRQAAQLLQYNLAIDSFTLDLPLTWGHISKKPGTCQLSIRETAIRLAASVDALRQAYPRAHFIDLEVPTGISMDQWQATLQEWLQEYQRATGSKLDGLILDAWWPFPWREVVAETVRDLHERQIKAGIFLNATPRPGMSPNEWIESAKRNACALNLARMPFDYIVLSSFQNVGVRMLPDRSGQTFTGYLRWYGDGASCPR